MCLGCFGAARARRGWESFAWADCGMVEPVALSPLGASVHHAAWMVDIEELI